MKKQLIAVLLVVLVLAGFLVYTQIVKPELDNRTITAVVPTEIVNEELGVGFVYPSGEQGFALIEPPVPAGVADGLQKVYLIMSTEDYIEYQQIDATDTPPSVSVFVFSMPEALPGSEGADRLAKLEIWAEVYSKYSSYGLRTAEPEVVEMDGVKVLRYATDGAYKQHVYLAFYKGNVYMFTGQYKLESDRIHEMFTDLIASVTFD